jgi:hypothetical protein
MPALELTTSESAEGNHSSDSESHGASQSIPSINQIMPCPFLLRYTKEDVELALALLVLCHVVCPFVGGIVEEETVNDDQMDQDSEDSDNYPQYDTPEYWAMVHQIRNQPRYRLWNDNLWGVEGGIP